MKKAGLVIMLLLLLISLPIVIFFVGQQQEIRSKAAPSTTLSLVPASQTKSPGSTVTFTVQIDTGTNQVTGSDLIITYNPSVLTINSLQKGSDISDFSEIQSKIDATSGKISYSTYTTNKANAIVGIKSILTISGQIKTTATAGTTVISFDSSTAVAALVEGINVLKGTVPATLVVTTTTTTGTPTLTPTPTPTSSRTPTPTPTASGTPHATPTPTPTPITTGTPSTSPTPSTLTITSPANGATVYNQTPTIEGTAAPGGTVTIIIYNPNAITTTVTAYSSGKWTYTPSYQLTEGSHTINVSDVLNGTTRTATITFTVQKNPPPVTGNEWLTWSVAAGGALIFFLGIMSIL